MDPDENLAEQLRLAAMLLVDPTDERDAARLAELVLAMDGWLVGGGDLPAAWRR